MSYFSLECLMEAYPELSMDAVHVLDEIAARMLHGQKIYGALDLDTDTRDFDREALEEDLDGLVYRACKIVR